MVKTVYTEDEDTNDPEYNFMGEDEERQDKEEVRFDKSVKIPSNVLLTNFLKSWNS